MKAPIKIKGIVTEEVVQMNDQSKYKIESDGKEYSILSSGRQAAKDNIFIKKGQHMEIAGKEALGENNNKYVLPEKSKIILCKGAKNCDARDC